MIDIGAGLSHHGDLDLRPGLVDLAVNVRAGQPPAWLVDRLAAVDLARYPDQVAARAAVAARHAVEPGQVLLTAGAAEAFVLIARALRPRRAVVIHPQFTAPETALRAAGHRVDRVVLAPPFTLDPAAVPADADLVLLGNPTNPTSVLHPAAAVRALTRSGRLVVVDEAFADCVPGEAESLVGAPGVVVIRSLTKTWGLAGLRIGYVLGDAAILARLGAAQPEWPVSALALAAAQACSTREAVGEAREWAVGLQAARSQFAAALSALPSVAVVAPAAASFLLVRTGRPELWNPLSAKGFAVRRGDTFPGLGPHWIRVAVRDELTSAAFAAAMKECL